MGEQAFGNPRTAEKMWRHPWSDFTLALPDLGEGSMINYVMDALRFYLERRQKRFSLSINLKKKKVDHGGVAIARGSKEE
mmetsp:Transcript_8132/g.14413  ORF Transcript_8132/g.14413 Transcript_8132/m.14413 type:complete len:80 (+) Transcript_8132:65-304(+)